MVELKKTNFLEGESPTLNCVWPFGMLYIKDETNVSCYSSFYLIGGVLGLGHLKKTGKIRKINLSETQNFSKTFHNIHV